MRGLILSALFLATLLLVSCEKCDEDNGIACTLDHAIVLPDVQQKIDALEAVPNVTKYILDQLVEDTDCNYFISGIKYDTGKDVVIVDYGDGELDAWASILGYEDEANNQGIGCPSGPTGGGMTTFPSTSGTGKGKKYAKQATCYKFEQVCDNDITTTTAVARSN